VTGGDAGKIIAVRYPIGLPPPNYYSGIPEGQKLTNAAVSPDGMFAIATSSKRVPSIYACLNPLGNPGDPGQPIDLNFAIPPASEVKCMSVGTNNLVVNLTTAFGPDNQPYFGAGSGLSSGLVKTFDADPGAAAAAWPQCIFNGFAFATPAPPALTEKLQAVFNAHGANHCGNVQPNAGFSSAAVTQTLAIIRHGSYLYTGLPGGVVQFKVAVDPISGASEYVFRTYVTGVSSSVTGLGVADDLRSLMVFTDPSGVGASLQEAITKLPLCEDMQ
jgi:hypothetical protein